MPASMHKTDTATSLQHGYTWRDVDRVLGLSRHVVTRLIRSGFVTPARGPRREYRFTFQDLVVLRAAHALVQENIAPARILRALRALRAKLPQEAPLTRLSIRAVGNEVVVCDGNAQWVPDDGQYVLQFDIAAPGGRVAFLEPRSAPRPVPVDWFARALELEASDPHAACEAYVKAIEADRTLRDAYVNLGCLLHERGLLARALDTYRAALANCPRDAVLLFNLAVVEEDLDDAVAAVLHYRDALKLDPRMADAHYNLARLHERQGAQQEALRHWNAYRRLSR
jgi:tetratricopeptide (TPR) repeat protein